MSIITYIVTVNEEDQDYAEDLIRAIVNASDGATAAVSKPIPKWRRTKKAPPMPTGSNA